MATAKKSAESISSDNRSRCECPICLDQFDNPKFLPCGHSLCAKCINDLCGGEGRHTPFVTIFCPVCRDGKQMQLEQLKPNFCLRDLIEQLKEEKESKHSCAECAGHYPTKELWACDECNKEFICSTCVLKSHRNHNLQKMTDLLGNRQRRIDDCRQQMETAAEVMESNGGAIMSDVKALGDQCRKLDQAFRRGLNPHFVKGLKAIKEERDSIMKDARDVRAKDFGSADRFENNLKEMPEKLESLKMKQESLKSDAALLLEVMKNATELACKVLPQVEVENESPSGEAAATARGTKNNDEFEIFGQRMSSPQNNASSDDVSIGARGEVPTYNWREDPIVNVVVPPPRYATSYADFVAFGGDFGGRRGGGLGHEHNNSRFGGGLSRGQENRGGRRRDNRGGRRGGFGGFRDD